MTKQELFQKVFTEIKDRQQKALDAWVSELQKEKIDYNECYRLMGEENALQDFRDFLFKIGFVEDLL